MKLSCEVVYPKSKIDIPISGYINSAGELQMPDEIHVTADEAWDWGVCLRCYLPLPLHPIERRGGKPRRKYCRAARREARA